MSILLSKLTNKRNNHCQTMFRRGKQYEKRTSNGYLTSLDESKRTHYTESSISTVKHKLRNIQGSTSVITEKI
ncbi:hypothetical protein KUTeg_012353 [Tegillarca granosa]|uniref:Uncharacterized protein n=1 Tax=Tegillarca granosa TaxID=220873 RepID=A0ABQ9EZA5_TEGGR|nr:hypothetical protein KUTeg_012353 [Tegillarca granosa]